MVIDSLCYEIKLFKITFTMPNVDQWTNNVEYYDCCRVGRATGNTTSIRPPQALSINEAVGRTSNLRSISSELLMDSYTCTPKSRNHKYTGTKQLVNRQMQHTIEFCDTIVTR
jgi:hypothetical protein